MMLNVQGHTKVTLPQEREDLRIIQNACDPHAKSLVPDMLLYTP
jgi:hypothetical protein